MSATDNSSINQRPPISLTHFGAAGWSITDGHTTVLLDPYLSRIRFKGRKLYTAIAQFATGDPSAFQLQAVQDFGKRR